MLTPRPTGGEADEFLSQLRANRDFEHLIVATLYGTGIAFAVRFILPLAADLIDGRSVFSALIAHFFAGLLYAALVFLIGFALAMFVGFPLAKRFARKGAFNIAIFFAVGFFLAFVTLVVSPPTDLSQTAFRVLPAAVIPALFWRERRSAQAPADRAPDMTGQSQAGSNKREDPSEPATQAATRVAKFERRQ